MKTPNGFLQAIFNANHTDIDWTLPTLKNKYSWELIFDSTDEANKDNKLSSGKTFKVPAWSVLLIEIKK